MSAANDYVLLTAAYNEEANLERVIRAVISQTLAPKEWVIVDDRSTDRTMEIAKCYSVDWPFIHVVRHTKEKSIGHNWAARVEAINHAYAQLTSKDYAYIGILDADISFEADYYSQIVERLKARSKLGIAGGNLHEMQDGRFQPRPGNRTFHVPGAVQLFRRECYEKVGGLKPYRGGHDDTVAETTARMHGWETESFLDVCFFHHRPTGITGTTVLRARFNEGTCQYSVGYHPLFQFVNCLARVHSRPFLLAALARFAGYWSFAIRGEKRHTSEEFVAYLRREQMQRIKSLFRRKPNAPKQGHVLTSHDN